MKEKGKLYHCFQLGLVVLCTEDSNERYFNGVVIESQNTFKLGEYITDWNSGTFTWFRKDITITNSHI